MTTLSYTLPTISNPNSTEDPLVRTALSDVKTAYNTDHAAAGHTLSWLASGTGGQIIVCNASGVPTYVTGTNFTMSNAGALTGVTDTALASPNNSTYKTLLTAGSVITADLSTGTTYIVGRKTVVTTGSVVNQNQMASGNTFTNDGASTSPIIANQFPFVYLDDADYTVASLTAKLRVRAQVSTNATAWSSVTATFGLYPITTAGGTDIVTPTLGSVVASSTVPIANPVANTTTSGASSDINFPTDGLYALGFTVSATLTNNASAFMTAQLQTRNT